MKILSITHDEKTGKGTIEYQGAKAGKLPSSKSGKNALVFSTGGAVDSGVELGDGRSIQANVNLYVAPEAPSKNGKSGGKKKKAAASDDE